MPTSISPQLFDGLSIYQDVLLGGVTALRGERDCETRWKLIEPHFPRSGVTLDVGSNFGWFPLTICQTFPAAVAISAEADFRSARVQREVLASHMATASDTNARSVAERICLITRRLHNRNMQTWIEAQQKFDAAICFNVLHWMKDHRRFLHVLGALAARLFIEHPHPDEEGAGHESVRREIGPIGSYLAEMFPHRATVCLGTVPSHRQQANDALRTIWMVEPPRHWSGQAAFGVDVPALSKFNVCWPPRAWWLDELEACATQTSAARAENHCTPQNPALWTPTGLHVAEAQAESTLLVLRAELEQLPTEFSPTWRQCLSDRWRQWRQLVGRGGLDRLG